MLAFSQGASFMLGEDNASIEVMLNGVSVGTLCFKLCCNAAGTTIGDVITSSVNNTYQCGMVDCASVCFSFKPMQIPGEPGAPPTCEAMNAAFVKQSIATQLSEYMKRQVEEVGKSYVNAFLSVKDDLEMESQYDYKLVTRAWYDRAGHRIRTVSPNGYEPVETESRDELPEYRDQQVTYTYNSAGQKLSGSSPDGGTALYYYDQLNRIRFSQTAEQSQQGKFSYVKYDKLGKIKEQGEATGQADKISPSYLKHKAKTDGEYPLKFTNTEITALSEVTRLYYNAPCNFTYAGYTQENLEGKLSCAVMDHDGDFITTPHDQERDYYSYDAMSRVSWYGQELSTQITTVSEIEYNLDGNVSEIKLNPGRADAFYHEYVYDKDNRLREVKTSRDGMVWSSDVSYDYRADGKLKKSTLGDREVHQSHYTYTVNGWLTSVSKSETGLSSDDAIGYSLVYNEQETPPGQFSHVELDETASGTERNLYNGMPSAQLISVGSGAQLRQFSYDIAGRLTGSEVNSWTKTGWNNGGGQFNSGYQYDDNGNLQSLIRNGNDGTSVAMDQLTYHYKPGNNQLDHVDNAVGSNTYVNKVKDQAAGNYRYNKNGELVEDASKGVSYERTVNGKPKHVTMTNGDVVTYRYNAKDEKVVQSTRLASGATEELSYVYGPSGSLQAIYKRITEPVQGGHERSRYDVDFMVRAQERVGIVNGPMLKEETHASGSIPALNLMPANDYGSTEAMIAYAESSLTGTAGNHWYSFTEGEIAAETVASSSVRVREVITNPTESQPLSAPGSSMTTEIVKAMTSIHGKDGGVVLSAVGEKLNLNTQVKLLNKDKQLIVYSPGVGTSIFHSYGLPMVLTRRPQRDHEYYLFTQLHSGNKVLIYRTTISTSKTGTGTQDHPAGEITNVNNLLLENATALQYGHAVTAIENLGGLKATRLIFLRHDKITNDIALTGHLLDRSGSVIASQTTPTFQGIPVSILQVSPDGKELMMLYQTTGAAVLQTATARIYSIGLSGELSFKEEITGLSKDIVAADFSPGNNFVYWIKKQTESGPATLADLTLGGAGTGTKPKGLRYVVYRTSRKDQTNTQEITTSLEDELFTGEAAIARDPSGKLIIAAGGHKRIVTITQPDAISTEVKVHHHPIPCATLGKGTFLSGVLATNSYDRDYKTESRQGVYSDDLDDRTYEVTDHLGNVIAVISATPEEDGPAILSSRYYYPFGSEMPGVSVNTDTKTHRFSFNGKEKESLTNNHDFHAREYDARIGRWLSVDPLAEQFAHLSPYNAMENNPLFKIDPTGAGAIAWREGNTIHIASVVYINGRGATNKKAREIEKDIMAIWGKEYKYTEPASGTTYDVQFHVSVKVAPKGMTIEDLDYWDNLITLVPGNAQPRVSTKNFQTGYWSYDSRLFSHFRQEEYDPQYAHEFGHLLHCDDLVRVTKSGFRTYILGPDKTMNVMHDLEFKSHIVGQWTINDMAEYVLDNEVVENELEVFQAVPITGNKILFNDATPWLKIEAWKQFYYRIEDELYPEPMQEIKWTPLPIEEQYNPFETNQPNRKR